MLEPGSMIAGKLRVERILGQGGMGTVAVATHVGLDHRVALKVLLPELANQPDVVARFVREARASARLKNEHVCRVSDVGQLDTGEPYIEMELLEGEDLSKLIERAPLAVETAVDYVLQACVAVAEAHQLGIVHRDLKPANLFVTRRLDGAALVKVLDFGIATAPSSTELKITKTQTVMGSPGYMSPEHLRSARDVDARSDIWSLGVILYEAVSGRLPFVADTITELAVKVVMDEPEPLAGVAPGFAAVVARCLQKAPEQRYQSVAELAAELAPFGGSGGHASAQLVAKLVPGSAQLSAPRVASAELQAAGLANTQMASASASTPKSPTTLAGASGSTTTEPRPRRRSPALLAGAAVLVLGGGVLGAVLMTRGSEPAKHPAAHDAALVATAADAAPAVDAGPAPRAVLRDKFQKLVEQKEWEAIVLIADLGQGDAELAPVIADAKQKYLAEELQEIAGHVRRGDCASAKANAEGAAKLLPDQAAALAHAADCQKKPTPRAPSKLDLANDAYEKQQYAQALALAEQAIAADPKNTDAVKLAARAACSAGNADKARTYVAKLDGADRKLALLICKSNKVSVGSLPPPELKPDGKPDTKPDTKPEKPEKIDVAKEFEAARAALASHNYTNVLTAAQRIVAAQPNNRDALRMLGVAACKVRQYDLAKATLAKVPPRGSAAMTIRRACGDNLD